VPSTICCVCSLPTIRVTSLRQLLTFACRWSCAIPFPPVLSAQVSPLSILFRNPTIVSDYLATELHKSCWHLYCLPLLTASTSTPLLSIDLAQFMILCFSIACTSVLPYADFYVSVSSHSLPRSANNAQSLVAKYPLRFWPYTRIRRTRAVLYTFSTVSMGHHTPASDYLKSLPQATES